MFLLPVLRTVRGASTGLAGHRISATHAEVAMIVSVLVALAIGTAIAFQAATIGRLADTVHPLAISLSLLSSGLLAGVGWATVRGAWPATLSVARYWWWLPLGAIGWIIVGALGWTVARLGAAVGLALVIAAQLTVALAIDVTRGSASLSLRSVLGVALLVAGAALVGSAR